MCDKNVCAVLTRISSKLELKAHHRTKHVTRN